MRSQRPFAGRERQIANGCGPMAERGKWSDTFEGPWRRMQTVSDDWQHMVVSFFLSQQFIRLCVSQHGAVFGRSSCSGSVANIWLIVPTWSISNLAAHFVRDRYIF